MMKLIDKKKKKSLIEEAQKCLEQIFKSKKRNFWQKMCHIIALQRKKILFSFFQFVCRVR